MALRARLQQIDEERHDRWMVSYADFVTLLFAFFVVMYAVSSVNDGKYRVLSDSLESAFRESLTRLVPIDLGGGARAGAGGAADQPERLLLALGNAVSELEEAELELSRDEIIDMQAAPPPDVDIRDLEQVRDYLNTRLATTVDASQFTIERGDAWLQIELQSELLFGSGSASLQQGSGSVLAEIVPVVTGMPGEIRVEGYTDDVPIATLRFPSNWELSAARAGSIVRFFEGHGVASDRLAAVGFGANQAIADNATEEGRRKNRRVVIAVAADPQLHLSGTDANREPRAAAAPSAASTAPSLATTAPVKALDQLALERVTALPPPLPIH